MIPGELFIQDGEIELNAGRKTVTLTVANTGDRPIQVGSHYHFFETNPALKFDRKKARGMRLDIAAGTAVRFEPGQTRDVQLVALAGKRVVYGFRGEVRASCEAMLTGLRLVSEAADFAARRHTGMVRKGRGNEPYVNHLAEVANLLSIATDGTDAELVAAGWLHDTIEDTETTREGLAQMFGERVAALVVEVTDDMTLPKDQRRKKQIVDAPTKSPAAKLIKTADKISNIRARILPRPSPEEREDLTDYVAWAEKVVAGCRGVNAALDRTFNATVQLARSTL